MGDFIAGGLTSAGSTTLPITSIYGGGTATSLVRVVELEMSNTSTTAAVALRLVRLITTGTRPTALTNGALSAHNPEGSTATVYLTHTVAPTIVELGKRVVLGPLGGVIWTWDDNQFVIPATANAGIGVVVENGTGQACQVDWTWKE